MPLIASFFLWFAQTAADWMAFRKRAARFGSTLARATQNVSRQTFVHTALNAIRDAPRALLERIVRYGSGTKAASTDALASGPSICGNGTYVNLTSFGSTPFFLSHLRTPRSAIVMGRVDGDRLADEVAGARDRLPGAATSAEFGFFGS